MESTEELQKLLLRNVFGLQEAKERRAELDRLIAVYEKRIERWTTDLINRGADQ